jgi:hypothetical protein
MRRKSNAADEPSLPSSDAPLTNDACSNNRYRKRLRSWKQCSSRPEPTPPSSNASTMLDSSTNSRRKSTIYTYPIDMNELSPQRQSSTLLSRSLTSESAFFSPSVPCQYIPSGNYLNNNYVPAQSKRRMSVASSCESLLSRLSPIHTSELDQNQQRLIDIDRRRFPCTYSLRSVVTYVDICRHRSDKSRETLASFVRGLDHFQSSVAHVSIAGRPTHD